MATGAVLWYHYRMFEITNELGQIQFSRNVIYRVCLDAVNATGEARIQNYKGRYTSKKPGRLNVFTQTEEDVEDIDIIETDQGLELTIYIVVRFGVSISGVANDIIDHICREMESLFGRQPSSVKVIVTGIVSKDIARRRIEFSR